MQATMERNLVIDAITAAIASKRLTDGVPFHSDRGSQHASEDFMELLKKHRIRASTSRKAEWWDNAVVESFFGTMKSELGDPIWESRAAARAAVASANGRAKSLIPQAKYDNEGLQKSEALIVYVRTEKNDAQSAAVNSIDRVRALRR
jgi:transposase InsO family protein